MKIERFQEVFKSIPQLTEERLISRREACVITASLFPPAIGKEIMSDYHSVLPEHRNDYYKSIAHMYCDGFIHYGLNQMISHMKAIELANTPLIEDSVEDDDRFDDCNNTV